MDLQSLLVAFGHAVKALPGGKVAGYGILFTDETSTDLAGDFFTAETNFEAEACAYKSSTYYHHGLDKTIGKKKLTVSEFKIDEVGVWFEAQLDLRDRYQAAIYGLAQKGELGWSTGTAPHLVEREAKGEANWIKQWPLGLDISLTPTPCESRTAAVAVKSLPESDIKAILTTMDKKDALSRALRAAFKPYVYVQDYSDFEVYTEGYDDDSNSYRYFAVPYTQNGEQFTFGVPYEVRVVQRYEPVLNSSSALGRKAFDQHSRETLESLESYLKRVEDYASLKAIDQRPIAVDRADEFKRIRDAIDLVLAGNLKPKQLSEETKSVMAADLLLARIRTKHT